MITKTGERLVKTGAILPKVKDAIVKGTHEMWTEYLAKKNTKDGHKIFADIVADDLRQQGLFLPEKDKGHLFMFGKKGDQNFYGNWDSLKHIAESRIGQLEHHGNYRYRDLDDKQMGELLENAFSDDVPGLYKGISFNKKVYDDLFEKGMLAGKPKRARTTQQYLFPWIKQEDLTRHAHHGYDKGALVSYLKANPDLMKDIRKTEENFNFRKFREYCLSNNIKMYDPQMYKRTGVGDIWVQKGTGPYDSMLVTKPSEIVLSKNPQNDHMFTTAYNRFMRDIQDDVDSGRVLNLVNGAFQKYR